MPRKILTRVEEVICHAAGVFSVVLRPLSSCPKYNPGQFLHLTLDDYDEKGGFWPESRVFSIISRSGDETLRILFAVKGRYTSRMEDELVAGKECWVKLPYGDFVIAPDRETQVMLLAGGTGVSPFIPFLRSLERYSFRGVDVFYGARTSELLIFKEMLERLASQDARISCHLYAESVSRQSGVNPGRIQIEDVITKIHDPSNVKIYVSGPPAMISYFVQELGTQAQLAGRIFIDSWE